MIVTGIRALGFAAALSLTAIVAAQAAGDHEPMLRAVGDKDVKPWLADTAIVDAIKAQNAKHAGLTQDQIDVMDKAWRAEVKSGSGKMVDAVLANALSQYLKQRKEASQGLFTEIFVMDNKGLNVGQSDVTSDYWQGDEAKWKNTFLVGAGGVDVSAIETDESTQTLQSQLSLPVVDPADGSVIGAITLGVNVEQLGG